MYNVTVAGLSQNVSSFDAARKTLRSLATAAADNIRETASFDNLRRLYRSSKTAMNEVNARRAQASKIENIKVPAKAGSYSDKVGGVAWSIAKAA